MTYETFFTLCLSWAIVRGCPSLNLYIMDALQLHQAFTSCQIFTLVLTRSLTPCIHTGKPQKWNYDLFSPKRMGLAYRLYNQAKNLPDIYETYILSFPLPGCFVEQVPYESISLDKIKNLLSCINIDLQK